MDHATLKHRVLQLLNGRSGFAGQIVRSLGMRVTSAGLTFAAVPVCLHAMGIRAFGEYAIAISLMHILGVIAKLGFDTASLRYVAQYRSQGEARLLRGFLQTARRCTFAASLVLACGLAGGAWLVSAHISGELHESLLWAACLLPLLSRVQLTEANLLARRRVVAGQLGGVLLPLQLIAFIAVRFLFTDEPLSSSAVVRINIGCACTTLAVLTALLKRREDATETAAMPQFRLREWMSVASPLLVVQLIFFLQNQSGTILCGWLIDEEAAGVYYALARVASVLLLGLQAIGMIAGPTIAGLFHSDRRAELKRYVRRCAFVSFGFAAAFALLMLVGGRAVLEFLGDGVEDGYVPLVTLLAGLAMSAAAGPVDQFLMMTGRQWDCTRVYVVVNVACLVIGLLIIPPLGVFGATMTSAISRIGVTLGMVLYARVRHGMWCLIGPLAAAPEPVSVAPRAAA